MINLKSVYIKTRSGLRKKLCMGIIAPALLTGCSVRVGTPDRSPSGTYNQYGYTPEYSQDLRRMEWPADAGLGPNEQLVYRNQIDVTTVDQLRQALASPANSKLIVVANSMVIDQTLPVYGREVALVANDPTVRLAFTSFGQLNVRDDGMPTASQQNLNSCQAIKGSGYNVSLRLRVPMERPFVSVDAPSSHVILLNGDANTSYKFDFRNNFGMLVLGGVGQSYDIDPSSNFNLIRVAAINARVSIGRAYRKPANMLLVGSNEMTRDSSLASRTCADLGSLDYLLSGAMTSDIDANALRCKSAGWDEVIANWNLCAGGDL